MALVRLLRLKRLTSRINSLRAFQQCNKTAFKITSEAYGGMCWWLDIRPTGVTYPSTCPWKVFLMWVQYLFSSFTMSFQCRSETTRPLSNTDVSAGEVCTDRTEWWRSEEHMIQRLSVLTSSLKFQSCLAKNYVLKFLEFWEELFTIMKS